MLLRSLVAGGVGIVLVRQLKWRERAELELALARERADAASKTKSEFLANMSHELRTPLNAVIGFAEVIKLAMAGPLNRRYREYGADIMESGTHLLQLINGILDLSRVEAGRMELRLGDIAIDGLISDVIRQLEGKRRNPEVDLVVRVPDVIAPVQGTVPG